MFKFDQPDLSEFDADDHLNGGLFQVRVLAQRQGDVFSNRHRTDERATLKRETDPFSHCVHFGG